MCGRYTVLANYGVLFERFDVAGLAPDAFTPRYNLAPSQEAPVIIQESGLRHLRPMRWGLIPSWAKDPKIGYKLINARAETAATKPSFRAAFQRRRCLIPADGFYEWKDKKPHRFTLPDDQPFAFAGLWESWHSPDDQIVESYTILTTDANPTVAPVHDRMPVILQQQHEASWIGDTAFSPRLSEQILVPYPGEMIAYPVSPIVNSPRNDSHECIEPL